MNTIALYIHWPFCKAKCPYCDFNSHVRAGIDVQRWQHAMLTELRHMAALMPNARLGSIFFGGGTPSLMPPALVGALLEEAARLFALQDDIEITLEANPTSAEASQFAGFAAAGVNRLSLGVQSLDEAQLKFLGREHDGAQARTAIALAHKHFARMSFDLIYALPNQTLAQWEGQLEEALGLAGEHLSLYQLTIEPNTAFYHDYHSKKRFALPEDALAADLYLATNARMQSAGLPAYEISNYARIGHESRHNLTYWRGGAYLGVGAGAHGRLCLPDGKGWIATQTLKSPERWLEQVEQQGHAIEVWQPIDPDERLREQLLTGLRLREGIARTPPLNALMDAAKVDFYAQQGLLVADASHLRATEQGWLLLNQLLGEIVL
jgi:putative oxygen-independent coproporphyrinogen III oxidase